MDWARRYDTALSIAAAVKEKTFRPMAAILCWVALVAGCVSNPLPPSPTPGAPGSATLAPTTIPTTTVPPSTSALQLALAGPLAMHIPSSWHQRPGSLNPSGDEPLLYLGPMELPSDCTVTAQGGTCAPWPMLNLGPGGMVVAVRLYGRPGSVPPSGGEAITVGGISARRIAEPADAQCQAIGGSQLIQIVLPSVPGTNGWVSVDACLAGGDAAATEVFNTIISSIAIG
jgi:hypothetical protein